MSHFVPLYVAVTLSIRLLVSLRLGYEYRKETRPYSIYMGLDGIINSAVRLFPLDGSAWIVRILHPSYLVRSDWRLDSALELFWTETLPS